MPGVKQAVDQRSHAEGRECNRIEEQVLLIESEDRLFRDLNHPRSDQCHEGKREKRPTGDHCQPKFDGVCRDVLRFDIRYRFPANSLPRRPRILRSVLSSDPR